MEKKRPLFIPFESLDQASSEIKYNIYIWTVKLLMNRFNLYVSMFNLDSLSLADDTAEEMLLN